MKNGTDEGNQVVYWKLSYRRKFIRTLWLIPFIILVLIALFVILDNPALVVGYAVLMIIATGLQLLYTYRRWKREEAEQQPEDQQKQ